MKVQIMRRTRFPVEVKLANTSLNVSVSKNAAKAYREIMSEHKLYEGVKLHEVMEAVYEKGREDGATLVLQKLKDQIANPRAMLK